MGAYDGTYISVESVRRTCGIGENEISDVDVGATITEIEAQVPRYFNTHFIPTEKIEILTGDGTNRLLVNQNPVLSVRELKIEGSTVDPADLEIWKDSGYVYLGEDADTATYVEDRNQVVIKYIYGTVEKSSTSTASTAASVAGSSVALAVSDETGFAEDDWVEVIGMDGYQEVAQITATASDEITVDKLVLTHESGSTITKLEINTNFTKLMNIIASIALVARIIGQSYDENTGYSIGELSIQKGEPYTQWRETANQFIKERDAMMKRISIRPYTI